jgi:ribose transport system substrate-binding protein
MKRTLVIIFCMVFLSYGSAISQNGKKSTNKKITIGMIGKIGTNPVFIAAHSGAKVAAKELGAKYKVEVIIDLKTPQTENVQEQASYLEQFSNAGVSGVAIACSDANYLAAAIDEVASKGIPIMCFDSDAPKSQRFAYTGADDAEFGKLLMQEIATELKGKGVIAVLAGNKNALNQQRRLAALKEELKKYPNITLPPGNIFHNLEVPEKAVQTFNRAQQNNPNIKGWVFLGSWSLLVKNSIQYKPGELKIVAGNAVPAELDYVKSGHVQSLAGVNCFQMGYKAVEILLDKILNNRNPKETKTYIPMVPVNKTNVNEWSINWKKWLIKETLNR